MSDETGELEELRRRIASNDRAIVELVNERLRLVTALWDWKAIHGAERLDPDRERRLREQLAGSNAGPLTEEEGLEQLVTELLALTKRELDG